MIPRSWLFVPGDSEAKLARAAQSGADALILDLEDSVAPSRKADARRIVAQFAEQGPATPLWLRINPLGSMDWEQDLDVAAQHAFDGVVLPKSQNGGSVWRVNRGLAERGVREEVGILPIATETPASIFSLGTYMAASSRLRGLTWGAEDLSSAVGAATAREPDGSYTDLYRFARSLCLAGARAAQVTPVETVYPDFRDLDGLGAYAARGRRDGFEGMMAIHPAQVRVINETFTPTADEVVFATRVTDAFAGSPGAGVLSLDGQMFDRPHLVRAQRILDRSAQARAR